MVASMSRPSRYISDGSQSATGRGCRYCGDTHGS
jgi:hypothetical protein